MVKHLYLMRHGETLFNVRRKIQGWCDSPLTENGVKQAKAVREILKDIHNSLVSKSMLLFTGVLRWKQSKRKKVSRNMTILQIMEFFVSYG